MNNITLAQPKGITDIGFGYNWGSVIVHTKAVNNISGAKPYGFNILLSKSKNDSVTFNKYGALITSGFQFSFTHFGSEILGKGIFLSRFIKPRFQISNNASFYVAGAFGLSYLSDPYQMNDHPTNNNYSLHLNPYMQLGAGFELTVFKKINIGVGVSVNHISNGNLQQPNKGINWYNYQTNLSYSSASRLIRRYKRNKDMSWKQNKAVYEIGFMFVPRQAYNSNWLVQRSCMLGGFGTLTKQFSNISAIRLGTEVYYNQWNNSTRDKPIQNGCVVGLQAGHVFLMGKVHFSQQLGINIYNKATFHTMVYHRWGLDYTIGTRYFMGLHLKANNDNADFFDIRFGLRL